MEAGGTGDGAIRPPSFAAGTDDFGDRTGEERRARFKASVHMLFHTDVSELGDEGASALYECVTEGMFGFPDEDGTVAFGRRASKDPRQNIEMLRRFVKGEYDLVLKETPLGMYIQFAKPLSDKGAYLLGQSIGSDKLPETILAQLNTLPTEEQCIVRQSHALIRRSINEITPANQETLLLIRRISMGAVSILVLLLLIKLLRKRIKSLLQVIFGLICFILLKVYQWLPFLGVLSLTGGAIGFIVGSDMAWRAFLVGVALLTLRFVLAFSFLKILERHSSRHSNADREQSQSKQSKIPVEITQEDIEAYERKQLKELESYKNDPAYSFDD